jgi:PAS domain S-box-containing protein
MKKKIIIFLVVASVVFVLAGVYIIASIEKTTSDLDNLIMLHQVEIMREHLLIRVQKVQSDLNLMGTRHARSYDTIVTDVTNMGDAVEICFDCHHTREVSERLTDLSRHIRHYKNGLSRVLTIKADASRLQAEEDVAFRTGEELVTKINTMIALTNRKLMEETESSLGKIGKTKTILFFLVTVAPIILGGFAFVFIRGFTKPVSMLLAATRKLKGGDLEHRVGALKDEFGEVAESFNEMAGALKEQMYKIEESEKRYRALFERAGDAIFIIDAEGENRFTIVAANQAAAEMHGYTEEELLTMKITDIGTPDAAEGAPLLFDNILKGSWVNVEVMHRKKDGVGFPVEISAGLLEL